MRLCIVTEDGEVVETIDLDDYNLDRPLAAAGLVADIRRVLSMASE